MREDLSLAGREAISQAEEVRRLQAESAEQVRGDSLSTKLFSAVDAPQGLVEVGDPFGGKALIENQGSLSAGAISIGKEVRSDWRSADWALPSGSSALDDALRDRSLDDDRDDGGSGGGDDSDDGDSSDDDGGSYCAFQILCYRGTCYENPPEPDAGVYRITGDYRFGNSSGAPGGPVDVTFSAASYVLSNGPSSDEVKVIVTDCDGNSSFFDNGFGGYRASTFSISRVGDFSCFPDLGPSCDADPEEWRSICSSNPPIRYTVDTNSDRSLVTITDAAGELAQLDFAPGQYQISVNCKEEGCPDADCSAHRFYYRDLPEPPDCPYEGGQCETLYNISGTGSYVASFRNPDGNRTFLNFNSTVLLGPITNPRVTERFSSRGKRIIEWFVDGFDRFSGAPVTRLLRSVFENFGQASDGQFETLIVARQDGLPDNCGDLPECQPSNPGPWTAGVLSFAPPIQIAATTNGDGSVTLAVYDGASSAADPLATYTLPDDNYETASRCEDEGPPPQ